MKAAFLKFANWIKNHLPSKRRLIQVYAALLYNANVKGYLSGRIFTGATKYACVPGFNCYSCPGAIGSCPLGSLQNALAASNTRAPYYVLGIIALFGLILGRTICGYLCPVGLGQELLYKVPTPKLKKSKFTRILSYLKYVILVAFVIIIPIMYGRANIAVPAFCKYICPAGTFGGGLGLLLNPANQDYLNMLGPIFTWKFSVMCVIIAACVFIYRAFCRFLCPLGAIYGFFNRFAFIGVKVDKDNCTDCGLCVSHCKMDIRHVGDHECINCGECIAVCPTKAISWKGGKITLRKNETATAVEDKAEAQAQPKLSAKIDGYKEPVLSDAESFAQDPTPIALNRLVLESAGIAAPSLTPDVGLPNGGEAPETTEEQIERPAEQLQQDKSERQDSVRQQDHGGEDQKIGSKSENSTKIDKKPRKKRPARFYAEIAVSIVLIIALVGVFVYYNVLLKDDEAVASDHELYIGSYALGDGGQITAQVTNSENANGNIEALSFESGEQGVALSFDVSYNDGEYACSYSSLLVKQGEESGVKGMYRGTLSLSKDEEDEEEPPVKLYDGEAVNVIFGDETFALQLGNEGQMAEGSLITHFALKEYLQDYEGFYEPTEQLFDMSEHIGEVTVINFWATWCGPCVKEIPYFEQLHANYPSVTVVAIHGIADNPATTPADLYVCEFIDGKKASAGWGGITFAQDIVQSKVSTTFVALGGKDAWPMTLIVDKTGVVRFIRQGSITYDALEKEVLKLM